MNADYQDEYKRKYLSVFICENLCPIKFIYGIVNHLREVFSAYICANLRPNEKMIYSCPHCRTQNFATPERFRLARSIPLRCWKCGRQIDKSSMEKRRLERGRRTQKRSKPSPI